MANYSFEDLLSPLDFEHLIRDLLSKDLGVELTAFAEGKDKGQDCRFSTISDGSIVVQCKRTKSLSEETLKKEKEKVELLNPKEYYFVTSSELSVNKFDEIKQEFSQWITSDKNIYHRSRLNNLLDNYKDIHHKHYKLWLNSSTIFNTLINKHLFERSKALISDIQRDYKYFVKNESFNKATEILNKSRFIIISGDPGIGKTTLAKLLIWEYLQKGFELIEIRKIIEGEQLLSEDSDNCQVYYFDDFLGENFLKFDVIEGRAGDLYSFILRIMNNKNKVLIMTTREYILKQAKEKYEKLNQQEIELYKHTLDLSSYSRKIRTLILYNHLYYSGISIEHIEDLITKKAYKSIINHKNYNPRLIERMTVKLKDVLPTDYSESFIRTLDFPLEIWNKSFESQISEGSRYVLFILLSFGEPVILSELKIAFNHFFNLVAKNNNIDFKPHDYRNYLKELEDSFIKTNITNKDEHYLDFQNPSIKDFLINVIVSDKEILKILIKSAIFYTQFAYILNFLTKKYRKDVEVKVMIAESISRDFDSFLPKTNIYSGTSYKGDLKSIDKLKKIEYFVNECNDDEIHQLFINEFLKIDFKSLHYYHQKWYIEFYNKYKSEIGIECSSLISDIYNKMSWYEDARNLLLLYKVDSKSLTDFIENRKDEIKTKVANIIFKEIEFNDKPDDLILFHDKLKADDSTLNNLLGVEVVKYYGDLTEKIDTLEKENPDENIEIEKVEILNTDDAFNEEDYFNIELFK
ncbi:MAG: restriction endonuclease [Ignavibacteriales bacterium]|nr:restriction endonuclease [Ignavibacteriales bacterium]